MDSTVLDAPSDAYYYFQGWDFINLGVSFCWSVPNVEIHLPFGFIRIGRTRPVDYQYFGKSS